MPEFRNGRIAAAFWLILAAALVAYHLTLIFYGLVPNLVSRPLHMAFILPFVLVLGNTSRWGAISGMFLAALGIAATVWIAINHDRLGDQYGFLESNLQVGIAITLLLVTLEAARRAIGWPLPLVAAAALLYGLLGQNIPGQFGHSGTPIASFLGTLTIAEGGIFGSLTGVSVSVVAIFVIFGAVLNAGEAGQGFMNVAGAAAGRLKGGGAKVSVISSALFGSISGSASANVASTGAITLPAMTKLGYPKRLAAAVEAVASSGGQIMPPLMGAGAFVMVELTGVPYTSIMAAAILPAILYFFAVWIGINAYATRFDLKGVDAADRPKGRDVIITSLFFLVPFSALLWAMFAGGFTPQYAAALAILAGALLLFINADLEFRPAQIAERFQGAVMIAAKQVSMIAAIILCASIIIGVLAITGLGVKITSLILEGSGGLLWPSLLLTAFACLILGMEVPTTAAYVICVSVAGPALTQLGLEPLQAHLFVFWFALLSTITPPVCGAVFIAAGMIGENWLKVALTAMALGVGLYLIPLGMIANPDIIRLIESPALAIIAMLRVAVGLALVSYGLISTRSFIKTALLVGAGLAVIFSGLYI
ncbi:TRAP transporter permease [Sulfitobacter geojensis]|uniref:TRAP transporter fused permease subunit n=1 Tax=Sulfitobacter geojensis TaxID=1342299 RepID=A0AAE3B7A0_9RHOB|nr:TRAP transporter fused permease subunit [Sulfitobacter geojensis]MBM1689989.1 TRAP transporter fused permease subunit [Sulfitobacter geojensis]MBM1694055.1 TRAP transporter fused permease subunit [Sulfitobacter geojensis]MBM1706221.1 TRAP transporter fused permease subunit [Sulfitobacter geojensis]MBM1710279.1 TRAP transporter fused permease subunit [Sulfitobacter geojensis]MBM1714345.1 TRAP transporter fused permease subunit [Sulfitobacter geojensis]